MSERRLPPGGGFFIAFVISAILWGSVGLVLRWTL